MKDTETDRIEKQGCTSTYIVKVAALCLYTIF